MIRFIYPLLHICIQVFLARDSMAMEALDMSNVKPIPRIPFIFVRHGQTDWGPQDLTLGPQDLALNAIGKKEAKQAAEYLFSNKISPYRLVSSPLKRALETAKKLDKYIHAQDLKVVEDLKERYFGDYRLVTDTHQIPPDAEDPRNFEKRVVQVMSHLLADYNDPSYAVIIVSHQKVFEILSTLLTGTLRKLDQAGIAYFTPCQEEGQEMWHLKIADIKVKKTSGLILGEGKSTE